MHHLLEWVQNGHADKYVKDVLQHPQPHESPSYWPAVSITFIIMLITKFLFLIGSLYSKFFFCSKILKHDQVDVQLQLCNPLLVIGRLL